MLDRDAPCWRESSLAFCHCPRARFKLFVLQYRIKRLENILQDWTCIPLQSSRSIFLKICLKGSVLKSSPRKLQEHYSSKTVRNCSCDMRLLHEATKRPLLPKILRPSSKELFYYCFLSTALPPNGSVLLLPVPDPLFPHRLLAPSTLPMSDCIFPVQFFEVGSTLTPYFFTFASFTTRSFASSAFFPTTFVLLPCCSGAAWSNAETYPTWLAMMNFLRPELPGEICFL